MFYLMFKGWFNYFLLSDLYQSPAYNQGQWGKKSCHQHQKALIASGDSLSYHQGETLALKSTFYWSPDLAEAD